jgi:hypothetical protein
VLPSGVTTRTATPADAPSLPAIMEEGIAGYAAWMPPGGRRSPRSSAPPR